MRTWAIVRTNWHKLGFRSILAKAIIWTEDCVFDLRYGTDTLKRECSVDPAVASANAADAIWYAPTRLRYFHALMRSFSFPRDSVFVDVGCGKGKVLMLAMDYPFKQVVGIEFSPRLCKIARTNLDNYCRRKRLRNIGHVHECDVATYAIPRDQTVFFLYHPFKERVMAAFIKNLNDSIARAPRPVWLIYYESMAACIDIIEQQGRFSLASQMSYFDKQFFLYERMCTAVPRPPKAVSPV